MTIYLGSNKVGLTNNVNESAVIQPLSITPTVYQQTIEAPEGIGGYNPISVSAVTSAVDSNIVAENIKSGISILGVEGTLEGVEGQTKTVTPTTSQQIITPDTGYNALISVVVDGVTSSIDPDITAGNIKSGVNILGVEGTLVELQGEVRTERLTSPSGNTFTPSSGKNGITSITVTPRNMDRIITPDVTNVYFPIPSGYSGNGFVTVNAVTSSIDSNIKAENIKDGVTILGVTGTLSTGLNRKVVNGKYQAPQAPDYFTFKLPSGANDISAYGMYYAFHSATGLTSADLSSLITVTGTYALQDAFAGCSNLTSVDLSNLATIEGSYAFNYTFAGCDGLSEIRFPSLTNVSRDTTFRNMLSGLHGQSEITVHFPRSLQSVIGRWSDVQNGFGGTTLGATVNVEFDL